VTRAQRLVAVRREFEDDGEIVHLAVLDDAEWALVLRVEPGVVRVVGLADGDDFTLADALGQHLGLPIIQMVDLGTGIVVVPMLTWVQPRCSWPGCTELRPSGGMRFRDGRVCTLHRDEALDLIAEGRS